MSPPQTIESGGSSANIMTFSNLFSVVMQITKAAKNVLTRGTFSSMSVWMPNPAAPSRSHQAATVESKY